jgi:hypothetical protein
VSPVQRTAFTVSALQSTPPNFNIATMGKDKKAQRARQRQVKEQSMQVTTQAVCRRVWLASMHSHADCATATVVCMLSAACTLHDDIYPNKRTAFIQEPLEASAAPLIDQVS